VPRSRYVNQAPALSGRLTFGHGLWCGVRAVQRWTMAVGFPTVLGFPCAFVFTGAELGSPPP
jgi:hypothetical protein